MNETGWKSLEHTSDLELVFFGKSQTELFKNAANGLIAQIVELDDVEVKEYITVSFNSETEKELLLDWLRELLYLVNVRMFLIKEVSRLVACKSANGFKLKAEVGGEKIDENRHQLLHEVKTVTYQDFSYHHEGETWMAQVVFDV